MVWDVLEIKTFYPINHITMIHAFFVLAAALLLLVSSAAALPIDFAYSGSNGPDQWGGLKTSYELCKSGKNQSPIDIIKDKLSDNPNLGHLSRDYTSSVNTTLVNHIFSTSLFFDKNAGDLTIDGKKYTLKQMHWHTPSEHKIDGEQFAAEAQLLHQANDGNVAAVAILYKEGDKDIFLSKLRDQLKQLANDKCGNEEVAQIDVGDVVIKNLKRKTRKYYRYKGSLTAPPCTEGIIWNVLGKVREISKEQIELLKAVLASPYKTNARPLQGLNDRKVEQYHSDDKDDDKDDDKETKKS